MSFFNIDTLRNGFFAIPSYLAAIPLYVTAPVFAASKFNRPRLLKILIALGFKVNVTNSNGDTPLHLACRSEDSNYSINETVTLLLNSGADVNAKDRNGCTPLHELCKYSQNGSAWMEVIPALIANGANVNANDDFQRTPLHDACLYNNWIDTPFKLSGLIYLLAHGAHINAQDKFGRTPLHQPFLQKHENGRYAHKSPLNNAASFIRYRFVLPFLLLVNGANPNIKDDYDETPLTLSKKSYDINRLLEKIRSRQSGEHEFLFAKANKIFEIMKSHIRTKLKLVDFFRNYDDNIRSFIASKEPLYVSLSEGLNNGQHGPRLRFMPKKQEKIELVSDLNRESSYNSVFVYRAKQ